MTAGKDRQFPGKGRIWVPAGKQGGAEDLSQGVGSVRKLRAM